MKRLFIQKKYDDKKYSILFILIQIELISANDLGKVNKNKNKKLKIIFVPLIK